VVVVVVVVLVVVVVVVVAAAAAVVVAVTIVLTQGQAEQTTYHTSEIFKTQTVNAACVQQIDKTIDGIMSACPVLTTEHCIKIRDSVCVQSTTLFHVQRNKGKIR
jgi:energy-converting hydrogenase Eha subunit A